MRAARLLFFLVLPACSTDIGQPMFQAALNATISDPELLAVACGREISPTEAHTAYIKTTYAGWHSSRSLFGEDGTGGVTFTYPSSSGAPCTADLTFSFHQETTMRQFAKRNITYQSQVELTDVVVTRR